MDAREVRVSALNLWLY